MILKVFEYFTNHRKKTNGQQFLAVDLSPTFLNTRTTDKTFQQSEKQDSFRHILKSSVSICESSGSQFFRITTGIQLGPDAFGESRFVKTFITILEVTEILCSFRLILEGKKVKRYTSHQDQSCQKSFQQTVVLYQMQKTTSPGH